MINKLRLGYAGQNLSTNYKINRSVKLLERGTEILDDCIRLARENLADLVKIMEWNYANGINFFRISSDIFPHISNWRVIGDKMNFRSLFYKPEIFETELAYVGKIAKKYEQRLTFHPGPFVVLNTDNHFGLVSVYREIYWHVRFLELAQLDLNSVIIIHGGAKGDNKEERMEKFIENFNVMPENMKCRIALENDETNFCINDIIYLSNIKPYEYAGVKFKYIPICFDYFHYICYNLYKKKYPKKYSTQWPLTKVFKLIKKTWRGRRQKMHLSEQMPDAQIGTHSDYVEEIPEELLNLDIDLMIEAKMKDMAVMHLLKKK